MLLAPEFGFDEAFVAESRDWLTGPRIGVAGLPDSRLSEIEEEWGFRFPPDLRWLLGASIGKLDRWESNDRDHMKEMLNWPLEGILFDVEQNDFWMERWGPKPADVADSFEVVRRDYENWPRLIPIYSHRYIAAEPHSPGNPIYSVYQTDIIIYGSNLVDYLRSEFSGRGCHCGEDVRRIDPWQTVIEMNC